MLVCTHPSQQAWQEQSGQSDETTTAGRASMLDELGMLVRRGSYHDTLQDSFVRAFEAELDDEIANIGIG